MEEPTFWTIGLKFETSVVLSSFGEERALWGCYFSSSESGVLAGIQSQPFMIIGES